MQQNIFLIGLFTLKLATFDTITISMRNSVQLNVDIDVVESDYIMFQRNPDIKT